MRPTVLRLLFASLLLLATVAIPATATARPIQAAASGNCPKPKPYPPAPNATVQSSTTTPRVGETIKASGNNYCADEDVTITIGGTKVGTGHTDGSGNFDPNVVVPGPAGKKQLCGIGASGLSNDSDCLTLTVLAAGGSPSATTGTGGGSGGGTAFTGVKIALICAVAVLLIAGGIAFATAGRRRTPAPLN